jgi:uncharacterized membrane protein
MTSRNDLNELAENLLGSATATLDENQVKVVESIASGEPIAENINTTYEDQLSFGDRLADKIALFGGSWYFIISFLLIMAIWIALNTLWLFKEPFDPYPFILLNLGLSTIAAVQAPFILMSQNRQSEKDRLKVEQSYQVSLKMDLEINRLHERLNSLIEQLERR